MITESTTGTVHEGRQIGNRKISERVFGGDIALWIIMGALAVFSLLVVYSSTASLAYKAAGGDTFHFFTNQLKYIAISFAVVWIVHRIDYQTYAKYSHLLFLFSVGLMIFTYFFGVNLNQANRWIMIPGLGITFQPSDFLKVTMIMVLARELAKRQATIRQTPLFPVIPLFHAKFSKKRKALNRQVFKETTLPLLLPIALGCAVIFPSSFSTASLTFVTCLIMLYIGRVSVYQIWRLVRVVIVVVGITVFAMYQLNIGRSDTWVARVERFVGIENTGTVSDDLQEREAKVAIACGKIIGTGPGLSTQRANLPHSYSDFAYAFIIEEYGLVGGMVVLLLYLALFYRTVKIFVKCKRVYPSLLVLGLGLLIVLQAFTNILVSVGLFPVTGQTLPLISLGGSSLVFTSLALGMILGVSRQMQEQSLGTAKEDGAK